MKLYAQGLARRLHAQRVGPLAEADGGPPGPPRLPRSPEDRSKPIKTDHGNGANGKNGDHLAPRDGCNGRHVSSCSSTQPDSSSHASLSGTDAEAALVASTYEPRVAHRVKPL